VSRAACLYLLGAAVVVLGTFTASLAHGNTAIASELSKEVHALDDTRARIQSTRARVEARVAELRAEFVRVEIEADEEAEAGRALAEVAQ